MKTLSNMDPQRAGLGSQRVWTTTMPAFATEALLHRAQNPDNENYYYLFRLKCALELARRGVISRDDIRAWFVKERMGL